MIEYTEFARFPVEHLNAKTVIAERAEEMVRVISEDRSRTLCTFNILEPMKLNTEVKKINDTFYILCYVRVGTQSFCFGQFDKNTYKLGVTDAEVRSFFEQLGNEILVFLQERKDFQIQQANTSHEALAKLLSKHPLQL